MDIDCGYRVPRIAVLQRSQAIGWIGYIIFGALAGWIAGKLVKGGWIRHSDEHRDRRRRCADRLGFLLSFCLDTAGSGGWWFTLFTGDASDR